MRPTDALPALCPEDWAAAADHPFCAKLAAGTLPAAKMRRYLIEDHRFIGEFVRLLATVIAHAPSLEDAVPAARFLALITGPKNTCFLRRFEALGAVWRHARGAGGLAGWSYLEWGERHAPPAEGLPFWFAEPIALHSGPGFREVVGYLRDQLDREWGRLDSAGRARVEAIFVETVRLERAVFDAARAAGA